jgi:hypothetical protein
MVSVVLTSRSVRRYHKLFESIQIKIAAYQVRMTRTWVFLDLIG